MVGSFAAQRVGRKDLYKPTTMRPDLPASPAFARSTRQSKSSMMWPAPTTKSSLARVGCAPAVERPNSLTLSSTSASLMRLPTIGYLNIEFMGGSGEAVLAGAGDIA